MQLKIKVIKTTLKILVILGVFGLIACQTSYGEKYKREHLEIYFEKGLKNFAEPLADYFFDHHLVSGQAQSLQLVSSKLQESNEGTIYLKMIDNDNNLSEIEKSELLKLEKEIREDVFLGANFEILPCNDNFIAIE